MLKAQLIPAKGRVWPPYKSHLNVKLTYAYHSVVLDNENFLAQKEHKHFCIMKRNLKAGLLEKLT
jgi:hypothetical protein